MRRLLKLSLRNWVIAGCYFLSLFCALSVASYGLAWHQYVDEAKRQNIRNEGYDGEGNVTSLRGFGIGRYKDYYLKVDSFPREITIPAVIANDLLIPDAFPKTDLSLVGKGDHVKVHTLGGKDPIYPVIIHLAVLKDGQYKEVVNWDASSRRFELVEAQGHNLGDRIIAKAKYALLLGPLGHLLIWLIGYVRRTRPSPGAGLTTTSN